MRTIIRFIAFVATVATILFCATYVSQAQVQKQPIYTAALDSTVFFPAYNRGKAYKVPGNRLGGSGGVSAGYVDSVNALTIVQILDSLGFMPGTPTVTVNGNIGQAEVVYASNRGGIIRWVNDTGVPEGEGVHIKVTYSTAFLQYAVPVISPFVAAGLIIPMSIASPVLPSFEVELGEDIPNGGAVGFTYHVIGK